MNPAVALPPPAATEAAPEAAGSAPPQLADVAALFLPVLQDALAPPGGGGDRGGGKPPRAQGARTAQSEGADQKTDTDSAEPVAQPAAPVAAALVQASLPVPPSGAPPHTDDAQEQGAGAHDARRTAASGLVPVAAARVEASQLSQDAAVDATRPAVSPADGTAAPVDATASAPQLGGTAAAAATGPTPVAVRGSTDHGAAPLPQAAAPDKTSTRPQAPAPAPAAKPASHRHAAAAAVRDAVRAATTTPVSAAPEATSPVDAPSAPATAPAAPAAVATPTAHARLHELPQSAQTLLEVATAAKATRARIVLTPPELGKVEIRLRYGSNGVSASFHADSPEAAQSLAGAAGDLRRALETQGIQVARIDLPTATATPSGQQGSPWPSSGGGANAGGQQPRGGHGGAQTPFRNSTLDPDDQTTLRTVLLGTGLDVLA